MKRFSILFSLLILVSACTSTRTKIAKHTGCDEKELTFQHSLETQVYEEYTAQCKGVDFTCSTSLFHFSCKKYHWR